MDEFINKLNRYINVNEINNLKRETKMKSKKLKKLELFIEFDEINYNPTVGEVFEVSWKLHERRIRDWISLNYNENGIRYWWGHRSVASCELGIVFDIRMDGNKHGYTLIMLDFNEKRDRWKMRLLESKRVMLVSGDEVCI